MRPSRSPFLLLVSLFFAVATSFPACSQQAEGDRCDPLSGNSDCESGLICDPEIKLCCPPEGQSVTVQACVLGASAASGGSGGAAGAAGSTGQAGSATQAGGAGQAGSGGSSQGSTCVPGAQLSCGCPGTTVTGVQTCNADGKSVSECAGCPGGEAGAGGEGGEAGAAGDPGSGGEAGAGGEGQ